MKKQEGIALITVVITIIFIIIIMLAFLFNKTEDIEENSVNIVNSVNNINNINKQEVSKENDFFVLYDGVEIEKKVGWINLFDNMTKLDEESEKRYNTKYYNYEKGNYVGESDGNFEYQLGYCFVKNVHKIATNQNYDGIPRKATLLEEIPEKIIDMADYSILKIESIDLDGDGLNEYIILCGVDYEKGQIGDGKQVASSTIMLFDSNLNKVADLVNLEEGFTSEEKTEDSKVFLSLDDVIYFDIDNDGIMEILIHIPTYEETELSIVKYSKGKIEGNINIEANVLPGSSTETTYKKALNKYFTLYSLVDDGSPILCSYDSLEQYGLQLYDTYEEMENDLVLSDKKITVEGNEISLYKTSIDFENYKSTMLGFVSEELFNKQFTTYQKNIDGILYVASNIGDGEKYEIIDMEKQNQNTYKVKYKYSYGEDEGSIKSLIATFEEGKYRNLVVKDVDFLN